MAGAPANSSAAAALVAPVERGRGPAGTSPAGRRTPEPAPAGRAPEVREQVPQIARARAIAVTKTAPTHRLQPGDLICGNCGEGNAPKRKFCSRCGDSLVEAAVAAKVPWWRRLRIRRGPKVVELGPEKGRTASGGRVSTPGLDLRHLASQTYRKARVAVAVAVLAAGVIYGIYPPFRAQVNSVFSSEKARVTGIVNTKYVPIHPIRCTATGQARAHPAANVCDGYFNNFWQAPWSASSEATITMTFGHPVTITRMILYNGAYGAYVANGRPSLLRLVFSNHESYTVTPQDTPRQQTLSIKHGVLVTSVQFQVGAIYQGTANPSDVAISQIELFGIQ